MIIIGCDYHLGFQQIAYVDTELGDWESDACHIARKRRISTAISRSREGRCAWGWKPVGMRAGSSEYWRN